MFMPEARAVADPLKERLEREAKRLAEQVALQQAELEGFKAEYAELSDIWKLLDTKAQVSAATAGVFLAGAFAVLRVANLKLDGVEKGLLAAALVALVASVICGFRTLELRTVNEPPRGGAFAQYFQDFYRTAEFEIGGAAMQSRLALFLHDQSRVWAGVIRVRKSGLESKARWTRWSHRLLAAGAIGFAFLSLYQLFK